MLKGKRGFTLLEILIVMIITGITLPVVGAAFYMLLKVPADETAKLSVLNDVNLALNWIHEDVNRGQFFAGDPAMLRSITTVDFSLGAGTNQSAWDKLGEPANTSDRGTQANASEYQWINASDNRSWNTSLATSNYQLDTQMFQFTVPSSLNISDLQGIVVSWKGNGTTTDLSADTAIKIWDNSSGNGSWKLLVRKSGMGTEGWLTGRVTLGTTNPPANYVLGGKIFVLASAERYVAAPTCPNLYGWDGNDYKHINPAAIGKIYPRLSGMDYEPTTGLVPKDGYYDLMLYEPALETSGFDQLGLWAVEHPEGTQIVTDGSGAIYTISDPKAVTAVDSYGRDVTEMLSAVGDDALWESDLSGKDFSNVSQLDDWITLTLPPDTPEEGMAKLVVDASYAPLTDLEQWYYFVYNLGTPNHDALMQRVDTWEGYENGSFAAFADMLLYDCSAFRVEVWDGSEWVYSTEVPSIGFKGHDIALIDLSQVTNNQIRIELPAAAYTIDYIAVDWTEDADVTVTELPLADATKHSKTDLGVEATEDVLSQVSAEDGSFATMETGDYINYRFKELEEEAEGMARSFVLASSGYYIRTGPQVAQDKSCNWDLQERFTYEPYAFRQMMYQIYTNPTEEINKSVYLYCEKPPFTEQTTHNSLITNYIKLMLLSPLQTTNTSTTNTTTYGGFFWVDRTGNESISYTTHYYYSNESHRLIREEWQDNELVSTITMAYNIQYYNDITFDFTPAGQSTMNILPYVVVDITASAGQGDTYTEAHGMSLMALRSISLSQGFAVLTTQGVGTGMDGILISGRKLFLDGSMRSLGNITVTGEDNLIAGNLISGTAESAGAIVDNGGAIADPKEYQTLGRVDFGGLVLADFVDNASIPASNEYIFPSDVNLDTAGYWADPPTNTVLRPGVYYSTNGNISLSKANVSGMVTLVSPQGRITITSQDSYLSPFCNGVLLFSNASYDDAIRFSGNGGGWSGSLFAPYGGVVINGTMTKSFCLFGSIGAQRFTYGANSSQPFMIKF